MCSHNTGSSLGLGAFLCLNESQVSVKWLKKQQQYSFENGQVQGLKMNEKAAIFKRPSESLGCLRLIKKSLQNLVQEAKHDEIEGWKLAQYHINRLLYPAHHGR